MQITLILQLHDFARKEIVTINALQTGTYVGRTMPVIVNFRIKYPVSMTMEKCLNLTLIQTRQSHNNYATYISNASITFHRCQT